MRWLIWTGLVLVLLVSGYWGNGNHLAVEVPVEDSAALHRLQQEKEQLERKVDDYKAWIDHLSVQIKSRNFVIAQYEQQLKALAVSVPPQPVILQAVQREAATPAGLQRVVARAFPGVKVRVE